MDTTYTVRFLPGNKEKPLEIFYQSKTHEIASELEHLLGAESLPPIRKKTFNRYDETGQLVESNEIDLFTDSKTQTKFRYET
ncbi:MAG: hypothetical protein LIP01_14480, partial [Tannerellaceae bacterium]|nr:hypothetical protein [Tannerellaceae bacterium]